MVRITDHRARTDLALVVRELLDVHFPDAEIVRLVLDNLNTHTLGSLYEAFEPPEARRLVQRLEIHYTPKHASWLNIARMSSGFSPPSVSIAGSKMPRSSGGKSPHGNVSVTRME